MSCDRDLGQPLELQNGSQASFPVAWGNLGRTSSPCHGIRPLLVFTVILWFFWICSRKLGVPRELQWGSEGTSRFAKRESTLFLNFKGELTFLSRCCREIVPHLEFRWEILCSFPIAMGISGFLSSCNGDLRNLSSCLMGVRSPFQL